MIGHWLLTLTPEQESRVLTRPFERLLPSRGARPDVLDKGSCARCLVLTATDGEQMFGPMGADLGQCPGYWYEDLCQRFGEKRINAAIRNRILANRAHRVLADVRETREAVPA
jgi:hypothetical protein